MADDIKLIWDNDLGEGDLEELPGDLATDPGLGTAVFISLWTDRRADDDDELDDPEDRRGCWMDILEEDTEPDYIGSKLWQIIRSTSTQENMLKAKEYAEECLAWMIEDEVAISIDITVLKFGTPSNYRMGIIVAIHKSDGKDEVFKYDDLWIAELSK